MKKIFSWLSIAAVLVSAALSVAVPIAQAATANWDVSGSWVSKHEFGGNIYTHGNNIVQALDGTLTGTGGWDGTQNGNLISTPNTWAIDSGSVSGDIIHFNYHYTSVETCALKGYIDAVINTDGSMAGTWHDDCGAGRTGAWTAPAGSAVYLRTAEITSPTSGEVVSGLVSFNATLNDKDGNDSVQWAVRQGTCAAGVGTVWGNVDGHSDSYTWEDGHSFSTTADTSLWAPGDYCFVFNPTESAGDAAIRLTREFVVVNPDMTAPTADLVFTTPGPSNTGFQVVYSESVVSTEATNPANYFLNNWPGAGGTGDLSGHATIAYDDPSHTATITFTTLGWYISPEQDWGVQNVHDLAGNLLSPNPTEETSTPMVPPAAPGIPTTVPNPTISTTQVWNWTAATDPTTVGIDASGVSYYEYSITGDTNVNWTNIGNVLNLTTNFPIGTYTLLVRAVDNAGNTGDESEGTVTVNSPTGTLVVNKYTVGGDGTFYLTGTGGLDTFSIVTANGAGSQVFSNLAPENYTVTEPSVPSGWQQTDNDCTNVVVTAGETASCTVTNVKIGTPKLGEIRGAKYEDRDGDGKLNHGFNRRLSGWTIYLDINNNGVLDPGEPSTVTNKFGEYRFKSLPTGTYYVREVGQSGWIQTYPASGFYAVKVTARKIAKKNNFGNFKLGVISGMKFEDKNGNGRKDKNEAGLTNWIITLTKPDHSTVTSITDSSGNYSFTDLGPGTYTVREVQLTGWHQTTKNPKDIKMRSGEVSKNNNFGNQQGQGNNDNDHNGHHYGNNNDNDNDGHNKPGR